MTNDDEGETAARGLRRVLDANKAAIDDQAKRALSLLRRIGDEVGGAVVQIAGDGSGAFLHPRLDEELKKPENQDLRDFIVDVTRLPR